ncbi:SprT family zinc-dependent metalloprotease [Mycoplasmatota bacterium zrk1]
MNKIVYEIKRSDRKTLSITIDNKGSILVKAPRKVSFQVIDNLVNSKEEWIRKKLNEISNRNELHKRKEFVSGEEFLFLGNTYLLDIRDVANIYIDDKYIVLPKAFLDNPVQKMSSWYMKCARKIFTDRTNEIGNMLGYSYKSVGISSAKKRWGSCSSVGKINFTWRLVMAPQEIIDYVIVHELVHLVHHNHSKKYWQTVERIMPDYRKRKEWLTRNQILLDLF